MNDLLKFPDHARVWIYGSNQLLDEHQIPEVHCAVQQFASQWMSHQQAVEATGGLLHGTFIVLVVNEQLNKPGGCSIDGSIQFIRQLGQDTGVEFLDRKYLYYLYDDQVRILPLDQLHDALNTDQVNMDTLFFDTLVQDKKSFQTEWLKPLHASWQKRFA